MVAPEQVRLAIPVEVAERIHVPRRIGDPRHPQRRPRASSTPDHRRTGAVVAPVDVRPARLVEVEIGRGRREHRGLHDRGAAGGDVQLAGSVDGDVIGKAAPVRQVLDASVRGDPAQ